MNILFYTDYAISGMTGGIGRVTEILTDNFRHRLGWKVFSIYAAEARPECTGTATDGAVCLRLHDRLGVRCGLRKNYARAVAFAEEHHIDVIIIQTSLDVVGKLRNSLDKHGMNHVVIVFCLHFNPGGDEWLVSNETYKNGIKEIVKFLISPVYNRWMHKSTIRHYKNAYKNADNVFLLSRTYVGEYMRYAGISDNHKFVDMPNPLSFSNISVDFEKKEKVVLIVARLSERQKRISLALRIWQSIERIYDDWSMIIVGEGESRSVYEETIQELSIRRCMLVGLANPESYYRRASLFLMTSAFEGFPMTLVEAQQMGCVPVVYDSFSALRDVVEDGRNGRIVADGDEQVFIKTLSGLMDDDSRRAELARNAMRDCRKYSQENIIQRWKEILCQETTHRRTSPASLRGSSR